MKIIKLTTFAVLTVASSVVASGCIKKPFSTVIPVETGIQNGQDVNTATTTAEIDTSTWKTYRNEEYGFEFKYPPEWKIEIRESNVRGFFLNNGSSYLAFLPYGEFDYGLPWMEPIKSEIKIGGKSFAKEIWNLDNGLVLEIYRVINVPSKWLRCDDSNKNCSRLELLANSSEEHEVLLEVLRTVAF